MGTNTGIGIGIGIPFKNNALGGDRPYLPPELKAKLIGVWDNYGKKNTDADRNIIKNKIPNAGGDLEILNAAYEGMSGYNGYPVIFGINKTWRYEASSRGSNYIYTINDNKYNFTQIYVVNAWAYSYIKQNGELTDYNKDVTSFKIKVTGLEPDKFLIKYNYLSSTDATVTSNIVISSDGIYELPKSFANDGSLIDNYGWVGFGFAKRSTDIPNTITDVNVTIEVLPEYEGAFVTDGIDDLITSTKTVQEMLGGSNECTVLSMMCQIGDTKDPLNRNNLLFASTSYLESRVEKEKTGKTGIYGYTSTNINNGQISNINTILGDKNDYTVNSKIESTGLDYFSVEGFQNEGIWYTSSVAWYWTIIANKVLTTDQINQVIAYFKLDRTLKSDIYCNIAKQGITNENHAEFGDKLIDFSGNGRDIQLNNIAWNKESGIDDDGALRLDGVNDFGKVTGMPIYKDYTFITEREFLSVPDGDNITNGSLVSKSDGTGKGAFIIEEITKQRARESSFSIGTNIIDYNTERIISYQSKYSYNGKVLTAGQVEDEDVMWLGTIRDNDTRFINATIYFLMSFPYSMSEFLIERQLKKHKLGTLYPGMVEFRPIISGRTDLIKEIKWYSDSWSKRIYVGDYIPKGVDVTANILLNDNASELVKATYGNNYTEVRKQVNWSETNNEWDLIIHNIGKSPQKIGITIDEYIRYEDIVQPYPSLFTLIDYDTEEVYSWGSKLRVGAKFKGNVVNLLPNMYEWQGDVLYNGKPINWNITPGVVAKEVIFSWNMPFKYLIDDNEPKCILSPSRLRIPNSSYKILGHIPDISGHGNHAVIHNSAYAGESGANGYGTNLGNWGINNANFGKIITQREEYLKYEVLNADKNLLFYNTKVENHTFVIYASVNTHITYSKESNIIANIPANIPTKVVCPKVGTILLRTDEPPTVGSIITVQQEGLYEGAFCFDGINDSVTIPSLITKQSLIKCNWTTQNYNKFLVDHRKDNASNAYSTNKTGSTDTQLAYNGRVTYIDGILNKHIIPDDLKEITHNIIVQYPNNIESETTIACSYDSRDYMTMALWDYISFPEISTEDKIEELNAYIGITPKVTFLYSKTISLLEINFLKNLMEKDEIIDINHPIFISNTEDESNASQDT